MTPAWSRDLAEVRLSPFWRGVEGMARRDVFVAQAAQYASYSDLPHLLKATYRQAARARLRAMRTHSR